MGNVGSVSASVMQHKKPRPVAVCTSCRAVADTTANVGATCGRTITRRTKCDGTLVIALQEKDWEECPGCYGSGYKGNASTICAYCQGGGWLFVRFSL
jgi:hypothetical protein